MDTLEQTIQEALDHAQPSVRAMAVAALIRARFHVIERDGATPDGLPLFVSVRKGTMRFAFVVGEGDPKLDL